MSKKKSAPSILEIHLLGPFRVAVDGRIVEERQWQRPKPKLLLKLLALRPHHQLHREQVMELLWPEQEPESAGNNLHKTIHLARHALEPELRTPADSHFLITHEQQIVLRAPARLWVDVDVFEQRAAEALKGTDVEAYETALALYEGDLLVEDLYEDWAAAQREQLRMTRKDLLAKLAQLYEARGEYERSIERLKEIVAVDPADEEGHRQLMRLYALTGSKRQSLRQFQICCDALRKELDAKPERATIELHDQIISGQIQPILPSGVPYDRESGKVFNSLAVEEGDDEGGASGPGEIVTSPPPILTPRPSRARRFPRAALVLVLGVLVLSSVALIVSRRFNNRRQDPSAPITSIAVLPLRNLSGDPSNDYFSDGMTESLISALSKVEGLTVISRGSVFRFNGKEVDPREVGRQLGVGAVLEGSVMKSGETVRVEVRLVSAADGRVLWSSDPQERALRDIFGLQDDIARSTVAGLKFKLSGEGEARLARRYTDNVEAYQLYLNGRYCWNKRTEEGLKQGIEYFEQAIAKDPRYAQAYAGLADSYILMGVGDYGVLPPKEAMPKAKDAALKALEIDDTLAEAHTSLGFLNYVFDWDWPAAESHFRRAIQLNPNYVTAHHWYGLYLGVMGRFEEGIEQTQRALELDPSSLIINTDLGLIYCYARLPDRAIEQLKKTLEREPNFVVARWRLARAYAQKEMYQEAISELQIAIKTSGRRPFYISLMGYVYALAGKRAEALRILKELQGLPQRQENWPALIATVYVGLDDRDRAFEWLDKAYKERFAALIALNVEPMFDNLRSDPRFADLRRRVGLAP